MEIIFKDINVTINKKFILHDVCGMVKPGDMLAVMGPSGLFIYCKTLYFRMPFIFASFAFDLLTRI